jgi:protein TonB
MTRLQKKCLIAVAGTHLLAVVVLLCSGFIRPTPQPDNAQVLDMIPSQLIEQAFNSGSRSAQPPPEPTPPQPVQLPPPPPHSDPVVPPKPVQPVVEPTPQPPVEQPDTARPLDEDEPKPKPKPEPHKIEVDLKPVVRKHTTEADNQAAAAEAAREAREAKRERELRAKAFAKAAHAIETEASSATEISMPEHSSVSYASYASVIKTIYERAWQAPDNAADDNANTRVSVTISRDGSVISAHIIEPSGDSGVDASVQRALDHVTFIAPFPDGASENQKEFIITFNLKAKRMFG